MNTLEKIWAIRIANYYHYYHSGFDMDRDCILDIKLEVIDKNTCIAINEEVATIHIFEMAEFKVYLAEELEGEDEDCKDLYANIIGFR